MKSKMITLDNKQYIWDGTKWYGADDYIEPPERVATKLNELVADQFAAEDDAIRNPEQLLYRAKQLKETGQLERALCLAKRAFASRPNHIGTAAVLSSILREMKHPAEALDITNRFRGTNYHPLLTSRAAALCDLNRWEEALKQIRQLFAKSGGKGTEESFLVYSRIKAAHPELIDK